MKRHIEEELIAWKKDVNRKPLLINGIRQVGKTWSIRDFGDRYFEESLYVNLDSDPSYKEIFERSKEPKKILFELSVLFEKKIEPHNTLIFIDGIQGCDEVIDSLKYFNEAEEEYFIIGAGSYLGSGVSHGATYPVGYVELLELRPMTYKEFLLALGQEMLVDYIEEIDTIEPISEPILRKMNQLLWEYYLVGGMPEAVMAWTESRELTLLEKVQDNIINAYFRDFSKYPPMSMVPKIIGIWNSIVSQLTKENRKFKYSTICKNARTREYIGAVEWLQAGKYIDKVSSVDKLSLPLKGYENLKNFKVYMPDTGLLRKMSDYPVSSLLGLRQDKKNPFREAIIENYVLQELRAAEVNNIYYWSEINHELDFVIQWKDTVLGIDVETGNGAQTKNIDNFLEEPNRGIRFSMKNIGFDGDVLNIPLAMVSEIHRLAGIQA
jgi:hypothetical protein